MADTTLDTVIRRGARIIGLVAVLHAIWSPGIALADEEMLVDPDAPGRFAYAAVGAATKGPEPIAAAAPVDVEIVSQVRAAVSAWLIASGFAWSASEPPAMRTPEHARICLTTTDCRDELSLKYGLSKIAIVTVRATGGGRHTVHLRIHATLSGTIDLQWMAAFGAEGPGELLRALPALDDAPRVTLTILRSPADATIVLNGWRLEAPAGDILLPAMLARSYDLVGSAPGYESTAIPVVAKGPGPVQVRCLLGKKTTGVPLPLWIGIGAGAAAVVAGLTALAVVLATRSKPPDSMLGHFDLE